jgi:tRNA(fMet)-specific endonuclease VapC
MEDLRIMRINAVFIDTSIIIRHYREQKQRNTYYKQICNDYEWIYTSSIVFAEVMIGAKDETLKFWNDLFKTVMMISFTKEIAMKTREIAFQLKRKNMLIELTDIMIAATAIENNMPFVTFNYKHFERIDGLQIVVPKQLITNNHNPITI